ncbi:MAG: glucose 1-dehydrogenase [Spirochaetaceae bacterium]|jgi:3-oxoacyl-[acyl-carrier protein] reductase|nr:glucose 1-dehydrogenase [Spirochaetaceae bacterium]
MHILEKYIDALGKFSADKIAELFAEKAVFNDSAMTPFGAEVIHFEGRENIRKGFTELLAPKNSYPQMLFLGGNNVEYDIVAGEVVIPCVGTAVVENDLIKEYRVKPRTTNSKTNSGDKLKGKVAVITGSTSGMGKATAKLFAQEGARVIVTGRNEGRAKKIVGEITSAGNEAAYVLADLGDPAGASKIVDFAVKTFGTVDILMNNAANHSLTPMNAIELEEWEYTFRVNVTAPLLLGKLAAPIMKKNGKGIIINVSSVAGVSAKYGAAAYCASKHGMIGLTKAMAAELKPEIRVNGIIPGAVLTPMLEAVGGAEAAKYMIDGSCVQRIGYPHDIARIALFLASEESSFVAGQFIRVDGGLDI